MIVGHKASFEWIHRQPHTDVGALPRTENSKERPWHEDVCTHHGGCFDRSDDGDMGTIVQDLEWDRDRPSVRPLTGLGDRYMNVERPAAGRASKGYKARSVRR